MSDDTIARYSFLPWLRQGIANTMQAATGLRVTVGLTVDVETDNSAVSATVNQEVELYGPGDITGLNSDVVIRTEPRNWITDFEPNYFPFVEFYEEDLPWRYSPQTAEDAGNRLTPWLALVVLKEDEFTDTALSSDSTLTAITVENAESVFPSHQQLFAWTHVHVNEDLGNDGARTTEEAILALGDALESNPDLAYSRLMCPRQMDAETGYHAFVIPSFEIGRKTGLGIELDPSLDTAVEPAWGSSNQEVFPVYYRWYFRTGQTGDFEYLVRQLKPHVMPPEVGIRNMDVQNPGSGLEGIDITDGVLGLEGALISPQAERTEWPEGTAPDSWQVAVADRVNLADTYTSQEGFAGDPIVTSPLYARWHALVSTLTAGTANWVHELNLDPRRRVGSGLGTRVVGKHQEQYVNEAWKQVGDILEANKIIGRAQLSKFGSLALYERNLIPLSTSACLNLSTAVHRRTLSSRAGDDLTARTTVADTIAHSSVPGAVFNPAFRKITRPRGPVIRAVDPDGDRKPANIPARVAEGEITATPRKTAPDSAVTFDDFARAIVPQPDSGGLGEIVGHPLFVWLAIMMLGVAIVLLILGLIPGVLAALIGAIAGVGFYLRSRFGPSPETAAPAGDTLEEDSLTVEAVEALPEAPGFRIVPAGGAAPPLSTTGSDSPDAERFKMALNDLHLVFEQQAAIASGIGPDLDLKLAQNDILAAVNPNTAIPKRTASRLRLSPGKRSQLLETFQPAMAYPEFPYPMYEPLRDLSAELLVPNINQVKQNTISLLETNQPFIESYMVGLNHEMGRELLWREYPTDQRGSYFRQFWDVEDYVNSNPTLTEAELEEKLRDIPPIDEWSRSSSLGDHNNREAYGDEAQLVLVFRGDLLKRYPTTVVYAQRAEWQRDEAGAIDRAKARTMDTTEGQERYPLYSARVEPDIAFLGFDLTAEEVKGGTGENPDDDPGWYFVLKERPGEPRFGFDSATDDASSTATTWDDLAWSHVTVSNGHAQVDDDVLASVSGSDNPDGVEWSSRSQAHEVAHITYQDPVLVAVHAAKMLA